MNAQFLNEKLLSFPEAIRLRIEKYSLENDRWARILSKLLLLEGLHHLFPDEKIDLQFLERTGKPTYENLPIHFTSSHSEDLVIVGFSKSHEIGVDVEFNENINTGIYTGFLHVNEQNFLEQSNHKAAVFYSIWAKKEALLKADGIGINADFKTIDCSKNEAYFNHTKYFFKEINLAANYTCFISSKINIENFTCKEIVF